MIIDYLDLAAKYEQIAKDGFRYQYKDGIKNKVYLSEEEAEEARNLIVEYKNKHEELIMHQN